MTEIDLSMATSRLKPDAAAAMLAIIFALLSWACGPSRAGISSTSAASSSSTAEAQGTAASVPTVDVVRVVSQRLNATVRLPGELRPYEAVAIYPKVTGFVKWMGVDRGSRVRSGQAIARLEAPELASQRREAEAKVQSARAQLTEGEAKLAADESTYQRLKAAAATPGVVSGNDLEVAQKAAEADRARVRSLQEGVEAAQAAVRSVQEIESYLEVRAPFDGVVTERNVHPGALVGPAGGPGAMVPMLRVEQVSRLRLVVPVPEANVSGVLEGAKVSFTVPAFPGETFSGTVSRIAHAIDEKTRTMPVELDVSNPKGRLAPGMFPEVGWALRRPQPTLFVPPSAVARTTERTFVVRVRDGKTEWVDVKTGSTSGKLVEVFGDLKEGDQVAVRGTDELRPDMRVTPRLVSAS